MPALDANITEVYVFRRGPRGIEFLQLLRRPGDYMGETWHPVTGGVKPGERASEAAQREMYEETGLEPIRLWQVDTVTPFYVARFDRVLLCCCFAAEVVSDGQVTLSEEHTDARWVSVTDVVGAMLWPGQRRAVREIVENIINPSPAEPFLRVPL